MALNKFSVLFLVHIALLLNSCFAEDPFVFYNFEVSYITASPLGVPQQVIAINNKFPGKAAGPLPDPPQDEYDKTFSMNQARSIRWNVSASEWIMASGQKIAGAHITSGMALPAPQHRFILQNAEATRCLFRNINHRQQIKTVYHGADTCLCTAPFPLVVFFPGGGDCRCLSDPSFPVRQMHYEVAELMAIWFGGCSNAESVVHQFRPFHSREYQGQGATASRKAFTD
ncbi:hypothetical protein V6N13_036404 [Hibiscus sabdariffa]